MAESKKNPYPKGSYRAKAWDRRERERAAENSGGDEDKSKDEVDEEVEKRKALGYFRQTTDSNNE